MYCTIFADNFQSITILYDDNKVRVLKILFAKTGISANCKHSAALYYFINNERTEGCTDEGQKWKTPSKKLQEQYPKGETIESLFAATVLPQTTFKPNYEELSKLANEMEQFGLVQASLYKSITVNKESVKVVHSELSQIACELKKVLFLSKANMNTGDLHPVNENNDNFFKLNILCDTEQAIDIFINTIGQSTTKEWFTARKFRISASKAHLIANARKKETCLKYFFEGSFDSTNLRYGRDMEPIAREKYRELTKNEIFQSGLVVQKEKPWLCASPDAIVKDENGQFFVLEIKCPSSCKDKKIVVPYLVNNSLKKSHQYYTQVQIQMFCCNLPLAHFFVFSETDCKLITVQRDDLFL